MDKLFDPGKDLLDTLRGIGADAAVRTTCTLSEDEFTFSLEAGASLRFAPEDGRKESLLGRILQ